MAFENLHDEIAELFGEAQESGGRYRDPELSIGLGVSRGNWLARSLGPKPRRERRYDRFVYLRVREAYRRETERLRASRVRYEPIKPIERPRDVCGCGARFEWRIGCPRPIHIGRCRVVADAAE